MQSLLGDQGRCPDVGWPVWEQTTNETGRVHPRKMCRCIYTVHTHSLSETHTRCYYHSSLLWPLSLFPGHSLSPIFGRLQCKIVFAYCEQSKFGVREDLGTRLLVTWRSSYKPSKYIVVMYFWFDYVPHGTPVGLKSLFQAFHSGFVQSCKRNFRIESQGSRLLKSNQAQLQNNPAK